MAMMWRRHEDQAELVTGSSLRITCTVDMVKTGARPDEQRSFELWLQAGPFLRRILKSVHKPTERLIDTVDAVLDGNSLVAANKLLPGGQRPRAYVFADGTGLRSGVLKVTKFASYGSPEIGIPNAATVKVEANIVLSVDPLVRFDLAFSKDTRNWLAHEVADFCDTAVFNVQAVFSEAGIDREGDESWRRLLSGDPGKIDELLDEETPDARRRELLPTYAQDRHLIDSLDGRESMRQAWSVVRVFGWEGVRALAELQAQLTRVDPQSLERTTLELADREVTAGEATELHLDEGQNLALALLAPLDAGDSTAVAIQATLVGDGPDDVPPGSTVIAPPLVVTIDGERVTVDVGQDEPVTVSRGDGMGTTKVPIPSI